MSAPFEKYSVTQYSINTILASIDAGEIAIPEIQRPFVWKATNVRDLIDSLFSGYPTGYLIIWQNPDVRLKNGTSAVGKKVLIDGQQRVTALMTAIAGREILTEDYERKVIRIAFNPLAQAGEERFAVQTSIHLNTRNWIPDISELFRPDFNSFDFIHQYMERNPEVSSQEINQSITQLVSIRSCQLGAILLMPQLDISEVTEIFVRVNSQGRILNESDFAMSKIAADERHGGHNLRKAIDYFCHLAVDPSFFEQFQANDKEFMKTDYAARLRWLKDDKEDIYDPDYSDMLRVSFMHMFARGRLQDLVSLLSGRDFSDRTYKADIAEDSFSRLSTGVMNFMNQYTFTQFTLAIRSAGFSSPKLISSQMTLNFAYTLMLLLYRDGTIPKTTLKRCIQKWYVLSTLTGRYTGSFESQMDRDMRDIVSKGFQQFFEDAESAILSDTFWEIQFVQNLETASTISPYYRVYIAAQIFFGDRSLLSNSSGVLDLMNAGDVHHIFPREYLKQNAFYSRSQYNQVANFAYLDTSVNIAIGMKAPEEYFSIALKQCETGEMKIGTITDEATYYKNLEMNCIPESIHSMRAADYPEFLNERRKRMARKIRKYYEAL